jgi:hypothetical protein
MPTEQASPLGRYDEGGRDEPTVVVQLLGVPVRVMAASTQHHDAMMREFALLSMAQRDEDERSDDDRATDNRPRRDVPARLVELVRVLGERYGRAGSRPEGEIDAAIERGEATVDLRYEVPPHVVEAADQLEAMMAEVDEFSRDEQLLTLARTDTMLEFARWYLGEFRRQVAGEQPRRWDGPLTV